MRSLTLLVVTAAALGAQSGTGSPIRWDLTAGSGGGAASASVGIVRTGDFLPGKRLLLGLGLRSTFVTGDLKLTPAGARNVPAGIIDTLSVSTSAAMLNVAAHVGVRLADRLEAGMNIDLAGFGAGASRASTYRASAGAAPVSVDASPSSTNVFLYGSKDRGSLNSEFFAAWNVSDRIAVRGGLSHQLVEYRASRVLTSNTDRFRHYANLLFLGARIAR